MKFVFKNLGPINEAELELGDLTIIAGRNNTGKTYVAYALYGFLKAWAGWPRLPEFLDELSQQPLASDTASHHPTMKALAKIVMKEGQVKWSVDRKTLNLERNLIMLEVAQDFSEEALAGVFSSSEKDFEGASIEVMIEDQSPENAPSKTLSLPTGDKFTLTYADDEMCLSRSKVGSRKLPAARGLSIAISDLYIDFLFTEFPEPFILSAERFGISLFYKELDFTKNRLVETLQKLGKDNERERFGPYLIIDKMASRYALPIKDNIDYTRSLPDIQRQRSELYDSKLFDDIRDMMGGSYRSSGDDIRFKSKARKGGFDIPLHTASSSARGLSDLYFFLRHVAKKNQLLIIDEPESHLDTANQIQLARLLARAVHAGLKVLITTHSDYLIKEINNLLMLSTDFKDKSKVLKKLKYSEHDFLKPDSVRAYVAENNSLRRCTIERYGIDMPVFDTTIHEINKVSNELGFRLKHEGEK